MKGKSESEVTQSCPTLIDPMDCSLPGSSVHGIFQARVHGFLGIHNVLIKGSIKKYIFFFFVFEEHGVPTLKESKLTLKSSEKI